MLHCCLGEHEAARSDAIEALGTPITGAGSVSGSLRKSGGLEVEAHLRFAVAGPKRKGAVTMDGKKTAGHWQFEKLSLEVEFRDDSIDLLQKKAP